MGTWGKAIAQFFPEIEWSYYVDNHKAGQEINGKTIKALSEIDNLANCYIVISVMFQYHTIVEQLLALGVKEECILVLGKIAEER